MPEARLQRTRETLPEGYQFGDAIRDREMGISLRFIQQWGVGVIFDDWMGDVEFMRRWHDQMAALQAQRTGEETV